MLRGPVVVLEISLGSIWMDLFAGENERTINYDLATTCSLPELSDKTDTQGWGGFSALH